MKTTVRLLILLPLLCQGLENVNGEVVETPICDPKLQQKYCQAQYGGDVHTGCKYCGIGKSGLKKIVKEGVVMISLLRKKLYSGHREFPGSGHFF